MRLKTAPVGLLSALLLGGAALAQQTPPTGGGVTPGGTAGGDLTGTYPNPTVGKVNGNTPGNTCAANTFVTVIDTSGRGTCTRPTLSNVSGAVVPPAAVSGNWYFGQIGRGSSMGTTSITTTYCGPFLNSRSITVQALGIWLGAGAAGGKIQLAIYGDNGSGLPLFTGGPLVSTGDITATGSAINVSGSVTAAAIPIGLDWACVMGNNTGITVNAYAGDVTYMGLYAGASTQAGLQSAVTAFVGGVTLTGQIYGVWPTSGTASTVTGAGTPQVQAESQ